ncbi:MAG: glycosyltransferase family protein [Candidatus Marsarchaeota archaeon]|nr:glycosyltransferase family protein [Candidatus Marsarchaeota archaeon]
MADVAGRPVLDHVINRAKQAQRLDLVTVATSDQPADDVIEQLCYDSRTPCFRGREDDVLDRYYRASAHFQADVVVRLTADCPLLDPTVTDNVVRTFLAGDYDYVSNALDPTYPDGLDSEVFRAETLRRVWLEARLKSEREHVTSFIWKRPALFRIGNVRHDVDLSGLRWTIDHTKDLEFVRAIYGYLGSEDSFGMMEVLALLDANPALLDLNSGINRNEGYRKSLLKDLVIGTEA